MIEDEQDGSIEEYLLFDKVGKKNNLKLSTINLKTKSLCLL
jgi:hypothetical protein